MRGAIFLFFIIAVWAGFIEEANNKYLELSGEAFPLYIQISEVYDCFNSSSPFSIILLNVFF